MTEKKIISVTGATGSQGGGLCRAILADPSGGFACRAITRDPGKEKAKALAAAGAQVVKADLDDVDGLKRAFAGTHGVYGVTNFWEHLSAEREKQQARNIADAARAAGARHVIWSTLEDTRPLMKPDDARMPLLQGKYRVPHFDAKAEADAFFEGLPVTFLVTSFYWDNLHMFGMAPRKENGGFGWAFPMANAKMPAIAAEDIGRAAYAIFKAGAPYVGKRVGVAGENLSFAEMSAKIEKTLGVGPVRFHDVTPDAFRGFGFPGAEEFGNMFQVYRDFEKQVVGGRSVEESRKLVPQLQTFEQWLAANREKVLAAMQPATVNA